MGTTTTITLTEAGGITRIEVKDGRKLRALFHLEPGHNVAQAITDEQATAVAFAAAQATAGEIVGGDPPGNTGTGGAGVGSR